MAVKASAQVTLHSVVDVQATYRYYLLQSSTLSVPSKPTTYPAPSPWDDTEPSYTEGSTSSLYFVDCTIFSDGSFKYSEISLSSSYEAAKTAYNKAVNAENTANDASTKGDEIYEHITNQNQEITDSFGSVVDEALKDYVKSDEFVHYKEEVTADFVNANGQIEAIFESSKTLSDANGDVTARVDELLKHVVIDQNGITIKLNENAMKLRLDNDLIGFYKGDIDENDLTKNRFGYWDGVDFHTGNIIIDVEERAQFGNFAYVPRSDGSLMFLKVGE